MKIGCIGAGNMGSAILAGLIASGTDPACITVSDPSEAARNAASAKGMRTGTGPEAAADADILLIAVKPQFLDGALAGIRDYIGEDCVILSIAAGQNLDSLIRRAGTTKIVRAMPNIAALQGKSMTAYTASPDVTEEEKERAVSVLRAFGEAAEVPETLMDAFTAAGGSAPAFVFQFIEAVADAAVLCGMPRDLSLRVAACMTEGAAAMCRADGRHPAVLKDAVCSPGGTTIEGVRVLEEGGFRGLVMDAVIAACEKSKSL